MSTISTHVLDTAMGGPAKGMMVEFAKLSGKDKWTSMGAFKTNKDGRVANLLAAGVKLVPGTYKLTFQTAAYFKAKKCPTFYPYASVVFDIKNKNEHYHVPLLVSGWSYSTYRGS